MSLFYEQMAAEADALLAEFGRDITFSRYADTYNAVSGVNSRVLSASETLKAAVLPASQGTIQAFDVRFFDGIVGAVDLRFAIVSVVGHTFVPSPGDQATFDGKTWNVLGCTPLNVDGTPVIFSIGFREA